MTALLFWNDMARLFDDALKQYLNLDHPIVTAVPFTMACWFYTDSATLEQTIMVISDWVSPNNHFRISADGLNPGDRVRVEKRDAATWVYTWTTTGYSVNTWHHACAVFAAVDETIVYIDGGSRSSVATMATPVGLNATNIAGHRRSKSVFKFFSGRICEAAIWDAALDQEDVDLLQLYRPRFVRSDDLVAYYRLLIGDEDEVGGHDMTPVNNPTFAECCDFEPMRTGDGVARVVWIPVGDD